NGLGGKINIGNRNYEGEMPPWKEFLNDEQVATILTYVRSSWGNQSSAVSPEDVARVRSETNDRQQLWSAEELN
ncbi:unnamed protein product, partial [Chrysoparadoxa australica]